MGGGLVMSREVEAGGRDEEVRKGPSLGGIWVVCGQGDPPNREGETGGAGGSVKSGAGGP